jgi:putative peptidoglycan lipid II flippase
MSLSGLSAILGIGTAAVTAVLFGTGREVEIFFAASALYMLAGQLIQMGQLSEILVPKYLGVREIHGREEAMLIFSGFVNWALPYLLGAIVVAFLLAEAVIRAYVPGFGPEGWELAAALFRALLPLLALSFLTGLARSFANAESVFGVLEFWDLLGKLAGLIGLVVLAPRVGVWALVWSHWLSAVLTMTGLLYTLRRLNYVHRWHVKSRSSEIIDVFKKSGSSLVGVLASVTYGFVFSAALSLLPQGSYAAYRYAQRVNSMIVVVLFKPLTTVFQTKFAERVAESSSELVRIVRRGLGAFLLLEVLAIVGVITALPFLVELLEHRHPEAGSFALAGYLLVFMVALELVGGMGAIWKKILAGLGEIHLQYWLGSLAFLVAAAVAWQAISNLGIPGVFLTLAFAAVSQAVVRFFLLRRRDRALAVGYVPSSLAKWAISGVVVGAAGYGCASLVAGGLASQGGRVVAGIVLSALSVAVTLIVAWLLRDVSARELVSQSRRLAAGLSGLRRS